MSEKPWVIAIAVCGIISTFLAFTMTITCSSWIINVGIYDRWYESWGKLFDVKQKTISEL